MENQVVIITGASSGMGFASARLFKQQGWTVYAGARRVEKMAELADQGIHTLKLDVTDKRSTQAFVQQVLAEQTRIDALINNAGYGEFGPAMDIPMENVEKQFATNFFGAVQLTQLVVPTMQAQGSGRIINISSVGGDVYMPLGAYYHATKAALQQWSDSLDMEIKSFGVRSLIVQPGGTQSSWADIAMDNAEKNLAPNLPYAPLVQGIRGTLKKFSSSATSEDLAHVFYKAATDTNPKRRYFNALTDHFMVLAARNTPNVYRWGLNQVIKRMSK